jgi:hypothetical protein
MVTPVRLTLPLLVAISVYSTAWPGPVIVVGSAVLVNVILGLAFPGIVTVSGGNGSGGPVGGLTVPPATLVTLLLSMSCWVRV